jgi:predicted dehydrogenase
MESKVLICGLGKMGRVHSKYLKKNSIKWAWHDPYIEKDENAFRGNLDNLDKYKFSHVIISTPEGTHYSVYEKVRLGFSGPILIEKPVILDRKNIDIFEDDKVYGGMVERFNPSIQALQAKMAVDKVINIDFTRCSAAPSVSKANIFEDIGIHDLDLYVYLMGSSECEFKLNVCSKTYCLTINKEESIARFIWSKETFFKERKIIIRQTDCTYMVDLQEQTLKKHYLDDIGRNIVEQIYVEKSSPVENQLRNFLDSTSPVKALLSHQLMFKILGR